ncbi:MAG: hypothetical protein FRX48_04680 [Lasallia pustulata]|uniref:FAS1 domain n=1 Tax=Lasallia pustulata TaxID=136370 RepID=A0A1W5D899_9LECA|nr:MAG: hypothetical protein FRX48_04680 [Lasallia pustulata]SLM39344.1 FAS1 domain [Lasallia pustulata]
MRTTLVFLLSLVCTVFAQQQTQDLTQLLNGNSNITQFAALIESFGDVYANLSFQRDITILAPSNDAFTKIPNSPIGSIFANNDSDAIRAILEYHVLLGLHRSDSFNSSFSFLPSWLLNSTYTNVTGGQVVSGVQQSPNVEVFVSGVGSRTQITSPNLNFTGGLLHVIDNFLEPPQSFINTAPTFNVTAAGGATAVANMTDFLDEFHDLTFFVPDNNAFQNLGSTLSTMSPSNLEKLLSYHIVDSSKFRGVAYGTKLFNGTVLPSLQGGNLTITFASNSLFVNQARIIQGDLLLANGVMHIIDSVLDYNASGVQPNPQLPTAAAIIPGSALPDNQVPFTSNLPSSVTSFVGATVSTEAGSAATTTYDSAATTTTDSGQATSTSTPKKKGAGNTLEARGAWMIGVLGSLVVVFGMR